MTKQLQHLIILTHSNNLKIQRQSITKLLALLHHADDHIRLAIFKALLNLIIEKKSSLYAKIMPFLINVKQEPCRCIKYVKAVSLSELAIFGYPLIQKKAVTTLLSLQEEPSHMIQLVLEHTFEKVSTHNSIVMFPTPLYLSNVDAAICP